MNVKNELPYSARWDSAGLDCSFCKHFNGPEAWPDEDGVSRCCLHNISLSVKLNEDGYCEGEWICKDFEDNGSAFPDSVDELKNIVPNLSDGVLYKLSQDDEFLQEYPFKEL
jgi:hypothetical protein